MISSLLGINAFFTVSSIISTKLTNKRSEKYLSKKGYKIKSNDELYPVEKVNNFLHDYFICFVPLLNIFKFIGNISKSRKEQSSERLEYLKTRDMIKFGRYSAYVRKSDKKERNNVIYKSNVSEMTLDEQRAYYKNVSDRLHKDYNKLVKLNNNKESAKVKEVMEMVDNIYFGILDDLELDYLKEYDNKNVQKMLRRGN